MAESRLSLGVSSGAVTVPEGQIVVVRPCAQADLSMLSAEQVHIVQGFRPDYDVWDGRGWQVSAEMPEGAAGAIVFLPRAKALARSLVAQAVALGGPVIVDGQKTDGIDSLYKALRTRCNVSGAYSKAHGKLFQIAAGADLSDWILPDTTRVSEDWVTAPGVFSADGPDAGSVALVNALPPLKGHVTDLGAGWGYLSAVALKNHPDIKTISLVEAEHDALVAARLNVTDPRASFYWADATSWQGGRMDHVIMNPPFHTNRKADPAIGQAFLRAAAKQLAPSGILWLVANRHLPYEQDLKALFGEVTELTGTSAFKLYRARKPLRSKR